MALAAGVLYVYRKSPHPSRFSRMVEASISGMIGYSVGDSAAEWAGVNEALSFLLITAVGYLALDVLTSIVADRRMLRDIIIKRLGGGNG